MSARDLPLEPVFDGSRTGTAAGEEAQKGKTMNHIGDGNKMVETPRTDAVIEICRDGSNEMHGEWVSSDFARQLERELQQWKEYAGRLEEAGDKLSAACQREWLTDGDIEAIQDDWEKPKEAKP